MLKKEFLLTLQHEAKWQQALAKERLMPEKLGGLANYIANHHWQVLFVLSLVSTILWNIFLFYR